MVFRDAPTEPPKPIIFDWDDTICPSSFVDRFQVEVFEDLPVRFQKLFNEIARVAERCLYEASKYGEVLLITNSDDGWVKFSCERYVPRLLPVIERYKIVSARTRYERFYPGQPLCWKAAAFAHEVNELYEMYTPDSDQNTSFGSMVSTDVSEASDESRIFKSNHYRSKEIISFGDSMEERTAVRIVAEQLAATPKSVMFIQTPTPVQIIGQLQMLTSHMKFVCTHATSLDLEISPEQAERCAESYMKRNRIVAGAEHHLADNMSRMLIHRTASASEDTGELIAASSSS